MSNTVTPEPYLFRQPRRFKWSTLLKLLGTLLVIAATVWPLYYIANVSLLPDTQVFRSKPAYFPPLGQIGIETYRKIFADFPIWQYIFNSFLICTLATVVTLAFSFSMAYYLAKFTFRFKRFFFYFIVWSLSLPWVVYVLPIFRIVDFFHLFDTHVLMIILFGFSGIPMFAWFAIPYMKEFPDEMIDAARIDGAGELSILLRIVRPSLNNVVIALFLIRFIFAYNALLYPLIFTVSKAKMIITVILDFPSPYEMPFAKMSAGGIISVVPIIILVIVFQRYVVSGLTGRTLK
ncbi:MAG TPA: carbohydrate ABC transporter permease [Spirochaetia bacterium]|nr:carbohydrate ABC transporter permease [Spirochaetia bacterium]HTZ51942.1 carbohydrate ABC transporter permease [Spirochaetia bacterium]